MFKTSSKIMLVDDEKDFVEMLSLRLKENGESVIAAYNGRECLDTLKKTPVDVVILDVKMPGMDGIETLKKNQESVSFGGSNHAHRTRHNPVGG